MGWNAHNLLVPRADIERHPLAAPGWAGARLRHEPQADLAAMLVLCGGLVGIWPFAVSKGDLIPILALCMFSWAAARNAHELVRLQGWYKLRNSGILRDLLLANADPVVTYAAYWHGASFLSTALRIVVSAIPPLVLVWCSGCIARMEELSTSLLAASGLVLALCGTWKHRFQSTFAISILPATVDHRQWIWYLFGVVGGFSLVLIRAGPSHLIVAGVAYCLAAGVALAATFPFPRATPIAREVLEAFAFDQREELARLLKVQWPDRPKD